MKLDSEKIRLVAMTVVMPKKNKNGDRQSDHDSSAAKKIENIFLFSKNFLPKNKLGVIVWALKSERATKATCK